MAARSPNRAKLNKAIKFLEQFERLAKKFGIALPRRRLAELRELREKGSIQADDLPAKLAREFPSALAGMTLDAIRRLAGKKE
jgi:hypothetical protein